MPRLICPQCEAEVEVEIDPGERGGYFIGPDIPPAVTGYGCDCWEKLSREERLVYDEQLMKQAIEDAEAEEEAFWDREYERRKEEGYYDEN